MIVTTDRDGKQSVTLVDGEVVRSITFSANRPLWQVRWWRRLTMTGVGLGVAAVVAIGLWLEESRSELLLRLTRENGLLAMDRQCRKQSPLIQVSWVDREAWVKTCVEKALNGRGTARAR